MYMNVDADAAWEQLRATRWNPPGRASSGARKRTYVSALEQAGQMFKAAAAVGPATRPLQIFYGLSQAGRAIAASSFSLKAEEWKLAAHGIKTTGFDRDFPDIEIRTDPPGSSGSFVRLSGVLNSPVWEKGVVRLEDMWDLLPTNLNYPLTGRARFTPLYVDQYSIDNEPHPMLSVPVCEIPDRVIDAGTREAFAEFIRSYPGLTQYESYVTTRMGADGPPEFCRYAHGGGEIQVNWSMPQGSSSEAERREHLRTLTRAYAGTRLFLPVVAGQSRELHPLMAWWAVVYTLSMLARYEPARWAALINVDGSEHAVLIERLMEHAMAHLPALIAETITETSC